MKLFLIFSKGDKYLTRLTIDISLHSAMNALGSELNIYMVVLRKITQLTQCLNLIPVKFWYSMILESPGNQFFTEWHQARFSGTKIITQLLWFYHKVKSITLENLTFLRIKQSLLTLKMETVTTYIIREVFCSFCPC